MFLAEKHIMNSSPDIQMYAAIHTMGNFTSNNKQTLLF